MFCRASVESVDCSTSRDQMLVAEVSVAKPMMYSTLRLAMRK